MHLVVEIHRGMYISYVQVSQLFSTYAINLFKVTTPRQRPGPAQAPATKVGHAHGLLTHSEEDWTISASLPAQAPFQNPKTLVDSLTNEDLMVI